MWGGVERGCCTSFSSSSAWDRPLVCWVVEKTCGVVIGQSSHHHQSRVAMRISNPCSVLSVWPRRPTRRPLWLDRSDAPDGMLKRAPPNPLRTTAACAPSMDQPTRPLSRQPAQDRGSDRGGVVGGLRARTMAGGWSRVGGHRRKVAVSASSCRFSVKRRRSRAPRRPRSIDLSVLIKSREDTLGFRRGVDRSIDRSSGRVRRSVDRPPHKNSGRTARHPIPSEESNHHAWRHSNQRGGSESAARLLLPLLASNPSCSQTIDQFNK